METFGEKDAGIEEYLSAEGLEIKCAIKHRYSDFIVNEIDMNGDVVWFKSELGNQKKWKQSNYRYTLPMELQAKLDAADAEDH